MFKIGSSDASGEIIISEICLTENNQIQENQCYYIPSKNNIEFGWVGFDFHPLENSKVI